MDSDDSDSWLGNGRLSLCLALLGRMSASQAMVASLSGGRKKHLLTKAAPSARTLDELLQQSDILSPAIIAKSIALTVFSRPLTLPAVRLLTPTWPQITGIAAGLAISLFIQLASRDLTARNKELTTL